MKLLVISVDELKEIIKTNVREALAEQLHPVPSITKPLNIDQAATYLGIPKATVYQLTSTREIPHQKLGRRLVFLTKELDDWVLSKRKKTRKQIESEATFRSRKGGKGV